MIRARSSPANWVNPASNCSRQGDPDLEPGRLARQRDEDVLRDFLRRLPIARPAQGGPKDQVHVAFGQAAKRRFRSLADECPEQFGVGQVDRRRCHSMEILPSDPRNRNARSRPGIWPSGT
jgi:hypothetical protein